MSSRRVVDPVRQEDDRARAVLAEERPVRHLREGVEERGVAGGLHGVDGREEPRRVGRERDLLAHGARREDVEGEVVAGEPLLDEGAHGGLGALHLPDEAHRAGAVEEDRERDGRVVAPREEIGHDGLAVDEERDVLFLEVLDGLAPQVGEDEGHHYVAHGHRTGSSCRRGDLRRQPGARHQGGRKEYRKKRKSLHQHYLRRSVGLSAGECRRLSAISRAKVRPEVALRRQKCDARYERSTGLRGARRRKRRT